MRTLHKIVLNLLILVTLPLEGHKLPQLDLQPVVMLLILVHLAQGLATLGKDLQKTLDTGFGRIILVLGVLEKLFEPIPKIQFVLLENF